MLNEWNRRTAEKCGILPLVEKLQSDLMTIEGVEDVDFDLDGFLDNIPYVIFLPKYNLPTDGFYARRKAMLCEILEIAAKNGLVRTEDSIEDYGQHLYIVTELRKGKNT